MRGRGRGRRRQGGKSHPEVIIARSPDLPSITQHVRDEPRAKVAGRVDCVSGLPAEAGADAVDDEEEAQRHEVARTDIPRVEQGVDEEHEERTSDELVEELARLCQVRRRVGGEDARRRVVRVPWDRAQTRAAFVHVHGGFVVAVDHRCGAHRAQHLRERVHG